MEEVKLDLKLIKMSDVDAEEIEWLWYPYIAYGKITIIQGDPGDGKTTVALNLAASISKGEGIDIGIDITEPMTVIYQTAEDGLADTVKPRLEQAGANCERIVVIDESEKSLSLLDERLERAIVETKAKLLILDPIQAYMENADINRANEARNMTKKIAVLAQKYKCAILFVGHMNKGGGAKAAYRGIGSIDFFAVARSVLLVGRIDGEPNLRAFVQIKNNLAPFGDSKAFELLDGGFAWKGNYEITADEVLAGIAPKGNKFEKAKQLLKDIAITNATIPSKDIIELANEEGISKRTLENAKKELGIKAKKINQAWHWDLESIHK